MPTTHHVHISRSRLLIDVIQNWPVTWLTDDLGCPYGQLDDAVEAILGHEQECVTIGCPAPGPDGRCPGHVQVEPRDPHG